MSRAQTVTIHLWPWERFAFFSEVQLLLAGKKKITKLIIKKNDHVLFTRLAIKFKAKNA